MCGILFVSRHDNKPAAKQALKRYNKQKARGSEGFGIVAFDSRVRDYKRFMFEHEMQEHVEGLTARNILLHHRYPTSVINLPETAHPIKVTHEELQYTYYVAHNGHISNDATLKEAHERLGYKYTTEVMTEYMTAKHKRWYGPAAWNDSEALAIELARTIEGKQARVDARGAIAYMVLQTLGNQPVALYYGTNGGNPLTLKQEKDFIAIASEGYTPIRANQGYRLDFATHAISEVRLSMEAAYTRPASTYSGHEYTAGYLKNYHKQESSTRQLEEDLADVEEELIQCQMEIQNCIDMGTLEEEEIWRADYEALQGQKKALERALEASILAI